MSENLAIAGYSLHFPPPRAQHAVDFPECGERLRQIPRHLDARDDIVAQRLAAELVGIADPQADVG